MRQTLTLLLGRVLWHTWLRSRDVRAAWLRFWRVRPAGCGCTGRDCMRCWIESTSRETDSLRLISLYRGMP